MAKQTVEGRKRLNQALSAFKTNPEVYEAALTKVGEDFVRASHVCCNAACVFSYKSPGHPCFVARSRGTRVSDLCFWCSPNIVSSAESSAAGIQRIIKFLRKFSSFPHVFEAAISKLSNNFVVDLCMASRDAENKAMLKEDRVEQCKQGRYYVEYMSDRSQTFWELPSP